MSKVFISYRRADAGYQPEIIKSTLSKFVDDKIIFYDHDIPLGDNFLDEIKSRLRSARVMLVIIGKDWLEILKERSKNPDAPDFVKFEIEEGLKKDGLESDFTIIPILFEGAMMPAPQDLPSSMQKLSTLNAISISQNELKPKLTELGKSLCKQINGPAICTLKRYKYYILAALAVLVGGYFGVRAIINKASCDPFSDHGDIKILLVADQKNHQEILTNQILLGLKPYEANLKMMNGNVVKLDPGDMMNMSINCNTEILVVGHQNKCYFTILDNSMRDFINTQYLVDPTHIKAAYDDIPLMTCIIRNFIAENKGLTMPFNFAECYQDSNLTMKDTLGMILNQSTAYIYEKQGKLDSAMMVYDKIRDTGGLNPDSVYTRMDRIATKTNNTSAEIIAKTGLAKQAEQKGDTKKSSLLKTQILKLKSKLNLDQEKVKPIDPSATPKSPTKSSTSSTKVHTTSNNGHHNLSSSLPTNALVPVKYFNIKMYQYLNKLINSGHYQKIEAIYQNNKEKIDTDPALSALYYESLYKAKKISDTKIPDQILEYNKRLDTDITIDKISKVQ